MMQRLWLGPGAQASQLLEETTMGAGRDAGRVQWKRVSVSTEVQAWPRERRMLVNRWSGNRK